MKINRALIFLLSSMLFLTAGCAGSLNLKIQESENQYVLKGDMKTAHHYAKQVLRSMGYSIDTYKTYYGEKQSAVYGVLVHAQKGLGDRVESALLSGLFGGEKDKIIDHYEDHREIIIKKRWNPKGDDYAEGELGLILAGGRYGISKKGVIVEKESLNKDNSERVQAGMKIQKLMDAYYENKK